MYVHAGVSIDHSFHPQHPAGGKGSQMHVHAPAHLGVVAHEGHPVAGVHGAAAEVALEDPHLAAPLNTSTPLCRPVPTTVRYKQQLQPRVRLVPCWCSLPSKPAALLLSGGGWATMPAASVHVCLFVYRWVSKDQAADRSKLCV